MNSTSSLPVCQQTTAIVTCHNYGRFLEECIRSLIGQSRPFQKIIVVDDSSDDNTAEVCAAFGDSIQVVRGEWRNFTLARRAGVEASGQVGFLLFVDADNYISTKFHEKLMAEMEDPRVGVAYPNIFYFGTSLDLLADRFNYRELRKRNYIDACALIRWEVYQQAGGWSGLNSLTDWLLWLNITRLGWTMKLQYQATLHYRRHGGNMGVRRVVEGRNKIDHLGVYQSGTIITIITLFSGRTWMLNKYVNMLNALAWDKSMLRIVAMDNSGSDTFSEILGYALRQTGIGHTIIRDNSRIVKDVASNVMADDRNLRALNSYNMSCHLAKLYATARQNMASATDFVWCIEDDIDVPTNALGDLVWGLHLSKTSGVISGAVESRFSEGLLTWEGSWQEYEKDDSSTKRIIAPPPAGETMEVMGGGLMCSLFRREAWDMIAFRPSPMWDTRRRPWYDWAVAREMNRLGFGWLLSGDVICGHCMADGKIIYPGEAKSFRIPVRLKIQITKKKVVKRKKSKPILTP